jgi:Na+-translocating ferredoxin:NAD+ oxidoreductase RnfC subunit
MHSCRPDLSPQVLLRLLQSGDVDAAIQAGLMQFRPCAVCEREDAGYALLCEPITQAQQQLSRSWAARDRYRARQARLARQASEREARRAPIPAQKAKAMLPPSAAAILARAKAKAAERHR